MKVYSLLLGSYRTNCYLAADDDGVCAVIDPGYTPERVLETAQQMCIRDSTCGSVTWLSSTNSRKSFGK